MGLLVPFRAVPYHNVTGTGPRMGPSSQTMTIKQGDAFHPDAGSAHDLHTARLIQESLRKHCITTRTAVTRSLRFIAGADAAYSDDTAYAAAVVMSFPGGQFVEAACSVRPAEFPYVPGLLSFREGPPVIDAVRTLSRKPDLLVVNGHGYAHPRRAGLACHLGVVLDIPVVGVARNLLAGTSALPGPGRGACEPVLDEDEVIGMAVRTRTGVKPVYVSAGHKVDLTQAVEIVMKTVTTHRFPEPLHLADLISRACRRSDESRAPGTAFHLVNKA